MQSGALTAKDRMMRHKRDRSSRHEHAVDLETFRRHDASACCRDRRVQAQRLQDECFEVREMLQLAVIGKVSDGGQLGVDPGEVLRLGREIIHHVREAFVHWIPDFALPLIAI